VLPLQFSSEGALRRVLCLGAHSDDIEIGCGATLLRLIANHPAVEVTWVVLGASGAREREARTSAQAFLRKAAKADIETATFRDGYFPYDGAAIKDYFEALKGRVKPDLIFTHHGADRHQDHRVTYELTRNTWRDHLILEYEIPKYDGDLGLPNAYVPVTAAQAKRKTALLLKHFGTQRNRHWFDEETFMGLMRLRGIESASPTRYAEAFHAPKLRLWG